MSPAPGDYDIHLDTKYGPLELIDVGAEAAAAEPWFNETLSQVNDAVVRLGVIEGDFHWHKHDDQDELFLVLRAGSSSTWTGATASRSSATRPTPSRAASCTARTHRTRTTILMVEAAGVVPTGDG